MSSSGGSSALRDISPRPPVNRGASPGIHAMMKEGYDPQAFANYPPLSSGPYQRFTSPHPASESGRSSSPNKRTPMPGPSAWGAHPFQNNQQQPQQQQQQQQQRPQPNGPHPYGAPAPPQPAQQGSGRMGASTFGQEPFLGYNNLFLAGLNADSRLAGGRDDDDGGAEIGRQRGNAQDVAESMGRLDLQAEGEALRGPRGGDDYASYMGGAPGGVQSMPGVPSSGSLSPRSLLHYHHQQLQAQHALALQAAQHTGAMQNTVSGGSSSMHEEITTVFIVGFPDDMTEREFANMFLFAKGFEASTLKIPAGGTGGVQREGSLSGPSGPYNSVQLQGMAPPSGGSNSQAWDDQALSLALSRGGGNDGSLAAFGNQQGQAGGKIKQIIGFAKFRTRADALEARDALNGRKIDAERGCVLKTEMAKKNLHTKQRPALIPGMRSSEGPGSAPSPYPTGMLSPVDRENASFPYLGRPSTAGQGQSQGPPPPGFPSQLDRVAQGGQYPSQEALFRHAEILRAAAASQNAGGGPPGLSANQREGSLQDKWATMGPLDFYSDDSSSRGPLQPQSSSRSDWGSVGSPPTSHAQARGPIGSAVPGRSQGYSSAAAAAGASNSSGSRPPTEDFGVGESRHEMHPDSNNHHLVRPDPVHHDRALASRLGTMGLGSPEVADTTIQQQQQQPSQQTQQQASRTPKPSNAAAERTTPQHSDSASSPPSSEVPSPTARGFVGDQNPPGTTLFVGNLPSSLNAASSAQLEEKLRGVFSSRPGFRQMSYKLKGHGPMCFVEFESVTYATQALHGVNGDSLNGLLKGQGVRLSYSKNPLFRNGNSHNSPPTQPLTNGFQSSNGPKTALADDFDMDKLNSIEESAYAQGFSGGFSHGALHGQIEGRALGREKGFDVWSEVGYYEGMAIMWRRLLLQGTPDQDRSRKQTKQMQQIDSLLSLVSSFPTRNQSNEMASAGQDDEAFDLAQMLERIRARYKLTASTIGFASSEGADDAEPQSRLVGAQPRLTEIGGRLIDLKQLKY